MEHLSHPGAPFVAQGASFHLSTFKGTIDTLKGDKLAHTHSLYAHTMGDKFDPDKHMGNTLGQLHWAGQHDETSRYPGEINWVNRGHGEQRMKGVISAMYHLGSQANMGQTTVPVHSPERSPEGEEWSAKVGGPRPPRGVNSWRPPEGIHPYEHRTKRGRIKPVIDASQGTLF